MILGLDISSSCTGYAVLNNNGEVATFGQVRPKAKLGHGQRYSFIVEGLKYVIRRYDITDVVIESYFVSQVRGQSTFICAECRGAVKAMLAEWLPNAVLQPEISPSTLKKGVTGNGRAGKLLVARTVLDKLGIEYTELKGNDKNCRFMVNGEKYYDDVSDALALAYLFYSK